MVAPPEKHGEIDMAEAPELEEVARSIREGDPARALAALKDRIRHDAGNSSLRLSLAQLEMITGNWQKASEAADTASTLDSTRELLCQQWKLLVQAEQTRGEVFSGRKTAIVMGEPEPWMAGLQDSCGARSGRL